MEGSGKTLAVSHKLSRGRLRNRLFGLKKERISTQGF